MMIVSIGPNSTGSGSLLADIGVIHRCADQEGHIDPQANAST
jgi:hypothetical protein